MRVSVVINTCDRGIYLSDTLQSLNQQSYKNFEVIVVNGPSIDDTEKIAKSFNVRYYSAPFNISISRNIGIKHAAGDIIAFIDDDAIPEPEWLEQLIEPYKDPTVGAVGGFVYNQNGSDFQFCYGRIDRWGYPESRQDKPYEHNDPGGDYYNINIGTNASYRRTALIDVGGFDEEIEYYHDESDVCVRLIKRGYKVAQLSKAYVHHKMAPSMRRDSGKVVKNWDAIVKNTLYFGLKNTNGSESLFRRVTYFLPIEGNKFKDMFFLLLRGHYTPWQYLVRNASLLRAFFRGYRRGLFQERKLIKGYKYNPGDFRKYVKVPSKSVLNIVLVSQGYPPLNTDGISRYNNTLAKQLAKNGHNVYVVTKLPKGSRESHTITYVDGHWVYSHNPDIIKDYHTGYGRTDNLLKLSKSVYTTVESIHGKVGVDVVFTPLWDVEGLALIRHKIAPVILTLMSPLKKVVETQWYYLEDPSLETVYELEKYCIENADGVMAISQGIKEAIGSLYSVNWIELQKSVPVEVIPLGVDQEIAQASEVAGGATDSNVSLLFVGRFERRKGVDVLFEALEELMPKYDNLTVNLVGNPEITDENNKKYYREFEKLHRKKDWFKRIVLHGYVSDSQLSGLYEQCDIFVAPSRYESFGIIFIEAMSHSKPVIGTNVGGIPEIIQDGKNGYLFENEDSAQLRDRIERLVVNKDLRREMGRESARLLKSKFSAGVMASNAEKIIQSVVSAKVN